MRTRRSFLALTTAALTATAGMPGANATSLNLTLSLPAPTGPLKVGATTLHLIERGRVDPWNNSPDRELMVTVFYPTRTVHAYPLMPQMTPRAAAAFAEFDARYLHPLPSEGVDWAATRTHSHLNAPAIPVRRPVLLYSPGGVDPRTLGTSTAEDLASHGYVVVTIDHPGETSEVDIPGQPLRTIQIPPTAPTDPAISRLMMTTRFADIRFVLAQLKVIAAGNLPSGLSQALDLRRIGIYGHSAGGATAAQALDENREIKAAVNLEGYLDFLPLQPGTPNELYPIAQHGTRKPLLLVGTDGFRDDRFDRSWSELLSHGGPVRRTELRCANHWVFTDFAAMAPQLQDAGLMSAGDRSDLVGAISPALSVPWVRNTVRTFFDRRL